MKKSELLLQAYEDSIVEEGLTLAMFLMDDDTVISWNRQFHDEGIEYSYVALKANGKWYVTGKQSYYTLSNAELVSTYLMHRTSPIWIVDAWREIMGAENEV
jgi:hypothetical protein